MKKLTQLSTLLILSLALCALVATAAPPSDPAISIVCTPDVAADCSTGTEILITGGKFSGQVILSVVGPDQVNIENDVPFHTPGGTLTAYEAPGLNGIWTVTVFDRKGNTLATKTFTCGGLI